MIHKVTISKEHGQYAQEFLCSFDAAVVGAYYGKLTINGETVGELRDDAAGLTIHLAA